MRAEDTRSGTPADVIVNATDLEGARRMAEGLGLVVLGVVPEDAEEPRKMPPLSPPLQPAPPAPHPLEVEHAAAVAAAAALTRTARRSVVMLLVMTVVAALALVRAGPWRRKALAPSAATRPVLAGARERELIEAAQQHNAEGVEAALAGSPPPAVDAVDALGNPAIIYATNGYNIEIDHAIVELLLAHGADVNQRGAGGRTPLHQQIGNSEYRRLMRQLLLAKGARVDAADDAGATPLHIAARANALEMLQDLLRAGANMHARDGRGQTPLHVAAAEGNLATVQVLVSHGAEVNLRDHDGQTSLRLAHLAQQDAVAGFLKLAGATE